MELEIFVAEKLQEITINLPKGYDFQDVINLICYGATEATWPPATSARFVKSVPQLQQNKAKNYKTRFLGYYNKFHCPVCSRILSLELKVVERGKYTCKECDNKSSKNYRSRNIESCKERSKEHYENNKPYYFARNAKARAVKLNASPSWSNEVTILAMYEECPEGYHVDHIIPLQGDLVCGLHVEENLQYLLAYDNIVKRNKVDLDLESSRQLEIIKSIYAK